MHVQYRHDDVVNSCMGQFDTLQLHTIGEIVDMPEVSGHQSDLGPEWALCIWLADMLHACEGLRTEQTNLLLRVWRDDLSAHANRLSETLDVPDTEDAPESIQGLRIVINDCRYVVIEGAAEFLDMTTGQRVREMPRPALRNVFYNITEMFIRNRARMVRVQRSREEAQSGNQPTGTVHSQTDVAERRDVRDDAVDPSDRQVHGGGDYMGARDNHHGAEAGVSGHQNSTEELRQAHGGHQHPHGR